MKLNERVLDIDRERELNDSNLTITILNAIQITNLKYLLVEFTSELKFTGEFTGGLLIIGYRDVEMHLGQTHLSIVQLTL